MSAAIKSKSPYYTDACPICGKGMIPMEGYSYCPGSGEGKHPGGAIVRTVNGEQQVHTLMKPR